MTPTKYFLAKVAFTQAATGQTFEDSWRLTVKSAPDLGTLMSAYGATKQQVEFFNSRVIGNADSPSPVIARENLAKKIKVEMDGGASYDTAFSRCYQPRKRSAAALPAGMIFLNDAADPQNAGCPVGGPQLWALFHLPIGTTQPEFSAAWKANGSRVAPLNPGKIFAGLCEYIQSSESLTYESALEKSKARFPQLWSLVQAIAKNA